jgi:hypothetical protein
MAKHLWVFTNMAFFYTWKFIQKKHQFIPQKWQSIFWILLFIIRKKKLLGLLTFEKNGFFGFWFLVFGFWTFENLDFKGIPT